MVIYEPHGNHKSKPYKNKQKIIRKEFNQNTIENQQIKGKEIKRKRNSEEQQKQ